MLRSNLVGQANRLASLYRDISRAALPYEEVRKVRRKRGTSCDTLIPDLDLYFSTIAGYCSWGRRLLMWDVEKIQKAKTYVTQGFFDKHPEYKALEPLMQQTDLIQQLGTYEEMRKGLLTLLISLERYRKD